MIVQAMKGCRPLTDKEVARVAEHFLGRSRDRALFLLGVKTGFRISELLSLRVGDVAGPDGIVPRITVRRRHMKRKIEGRTVLVHPKAKAALADWLDELHRAGHAEPEAPLFRSRGLFGRALTRVQAHRILQAAFDRCGIRGQTGTHCMRKTFAQNVHQALDGDLVKTQRALGHRNINSTVSYLSFAEEDIDEAILAS